MKYIILNLLIGSIIFASINLNAHNIKLVNESKDSALIVDFVGEQSSQMQVLPNQTATMQTPDEKEAIFMLKLFKYNHITSQLISVIAETHLNTNFIDKNY